MVPCALRATAFANVTELNYLIEFEIWEAASAVVAP